MASGNTKDKRGVDDIAEYLELRQIINLVMDAPDILYETAAEYRHRRDRALLAALALTGMRISELLSIDKSQVKEEGQFMWFKNVKIQKRRKEHILRDFPLPLEGASNRFT